ncbi:hypothetical protein JVT61DRAFT_10195 [Boletus reticuloceps]|uniref:Uncharacterized protein n=1 Tax=Boletus reticuloceps TaxID=495285 RepID=A0A8I2YUL6_9AGAM|nr:hypothetical protein JVT61DRAFT_10195 [Boletus reticuloceps]
MSTPAVSFAPPPAVLSKPWDASQDPTFAFAKLQRDVCLVQLVGQSSIDPSGTPLLDIHVFRHEFVSMFRYSYSARVHPLELRVLEPLDDHAVRYEPDNGSVFLAKDLMAHLRRILDASSMFSRIGRRTVPSRQR